MGFRKRSRRAGMSERAPIAGYSCAERRIPMKPCYGFCMSAPDLNLLFALDVLLAEGSVARAARRLGMSPSAMSRTLARLRKATGDPLLVRAGRGLVPTPRALILREPVSRLVHEGQLVLRPADKVDLANLVRTFTLRTSEGFVETFGPRLIARLAEQAPRVRLRFVQKPDKDSAPLRDGTVDLETGVASGSAGPEVRAQGLFRDRFVGAVRTGHPFTEGEITPSRYAAGPHIGVSRRGLDRGPPDEALAPLGLERKIVTIVAGYSTALALARATDFVATVPDHHTAALRTGMFSFEIPLPMPQIVVSLLWHPRMDADPAHRWLRGCIRAVCREKLAEETTKS